MDEKTPDSPAFDPAAFRAFDNPVLFREIEDFDDASIYKAPGAHVSGLVEFASDVNLWPGAVVRADIAPVTIGTGSNVQDNATIHVDFGFPATIGADVTIGHGAILHGCTIGNGTLIGMGAIILDGAEIGEGSIVGAGALVTQNKKFPPNSLVFGSPAKLVRETTPEERASNIQNARLYVELARRTRDANA